MYWFLLARDPPDYQSLMAPVLGALADGQKQPNSHLRETLAGQLHLTEEDLKATIPRGTCRPQEGSDRIGQRIRYLAWNSG